jgi:nucleoid-associated protein YgaU
VNKPVLIAILGIFAVVAAITLNFALQWDDDDQARRAPADRPAMTAQGGAKAPQPSAPPAGAERGDGPSFDVVRINPNGDTVIAGRAKPGTRVEIYDDDTKIGEVEADRRGEWVFVPDQPLSPGSRRLSLQMRDKDGTTVPGSSDVVVVVPERSGDGQALAMRVPREGQPGSVEILQKPTDGSKPSAPAGDGGPALSVDAVDYDSAGKLEIVGKAPPGSLVQLYLNNEFLGRTQANERGQWSLRPEKPVAAGNHLMRADQVDKDGKVSSRLEVHFARAQPLKDVQPGSLVVVREGNSLWRIARRTYGTGFKFTDIFEANRDQIKNADLIYPGQVFKLPQMN